MSIYSSIRTALRLGTIEALNQSGYLNIPVIYSHQNGTEPAGSYVVIQVVNMKQTGRTEQAALPDNSIPKKKLAYKNHYEALIQFSFGGSQAADMAHEFFNAVPGNVVVREAYQKKNLSPLRKSTLRYSPQKRDTKWVDFFNVDVTFSYMVYTEQEVVDWVEHVTIVDANTGEIITPPTPVTPIPPTP